MGGGLREGGDQILQEWDLCFFEGTVPQLSKISILPHFRGHTSREDL